MNRAIAAVACACLVAACTKQRVPSSGAEWANVPDVVRFAEPESLATLDAPAFVTADASGYADDEPVLGLVGADGVARAYSLRVLERRPVVNDTQAVVFDPVSGAAAAYARRGMLGTSGLLHRDALVVHDRDATTMFSALTGEALGGQRNAKALVEWPSVRTEWSYWRALHPTSLALARTAADEAPLAFAPSDGLVVDGLDAAAWVVAVRLGGESRAWPLDTAAEVVNDRVGEVPVVVVLLPAGATAFLRGTLTLRHAGTALDDGAGNLFAFDGVAFQGPLRGQRLAMPPSVRVTRWGPWKRAFPSTTLAAE